MAAAPNALVRPVAVTDQRLEPLRPMPLQTVQRAMAEYQQGLQAILNETDWQMFRDRGGDPKRFVKRSGWRKIATWFGLDLLVDDTSIVVDRDERGDPLRARVKGRVAAPNGRVAEDVGACSITERGFSKPEHDLVATAATRALNRATSNLVGMGELSAEEMIDDVEPLLPEWALMAEGEALATMHAKLGELLGPKRGDALMRAIDERYSGIPNVATGFVNAIYSMLAVELRGLRGSGSSDQEEGK